jgi:uncharacterized RDD family membrane protein YckC
MKAKFFQRALAYILDLFLIGLVMAVVKTILPDSHSIINLNNELDKISNLFFDNKINMSVYINRYSEAYYNLNYKLVLSDVFQFVVFIGYFIVFQYYNNGQTIGKKLWGIRVVADDSKVLSMNNYVIRALIIYGLFFNMINLCTIFILNNKWYYLGAVTSGFIQTLIVMISIFMVLYKKDGKGIHDYIARTKVVVDGEEK